MNDLISRQAALNALYERCESECEYSKKQRSVMCDACYLGSAKEVIEELPTIDPVKHGKWESNEYLYTTGQTRCSECKTEFYVDDLLNVGEGAQEYLPNYCPHCGARMDL